MVRPGSSAKRFLSAQILSVKRHTITSATVVTFVYLTACLSAE